MRRALVLQGGGGKGAFQAGVLEVLDRFGFRFSWLFGVSVGALNVAGYAVGGVQLLQRVWSRLRESDVFVKHGWSGILWRLVRGKRSIYDFSPLLKTIRRELAGDGPYLDARAGTVELTTGRYVSGPATAETVFASASMPVYAEPVKGHVDGGVRHVTPLAEAIDCGAEEIVVVLCSPRALPAADEPANVLEVALRSLEIAMHEIATADIRETMRVNDLVLEYAGRGAVPCSPSGVPYRYVPIHVIEPAAPLGGTLDFARNVLDQRYAAGRAAAFQFLGLKETP
jgi:NTE family protein